MFTCAVSMWMLGLGLCYYRQFMQQTVIFFLFATYITTCFGEDIDFLTNDNVLRISGNVSKLVHDRSQRMRELNSNEVSIEPIHGLYLQDLGAVIAGNLRKVSNDELGVTVLQEIYDHLEFEPGAKDDKKKANELTERLQMKLRKYIAVLNKSRAAVEEMFWRHASRPASAAFPCCDADSNSLYNEHFATKVVKSLNCEIPLPHSGHFGFDPGTNLTEVFSSNLKSYPTIKWQYFMSSSDLQSKPFSLLFDESTPCKQYDNVRHRDIFFATVQPYSKSVIVMMDHGNSLSLNQFNLAKTISKHIISSLSNHDRLAVISLAEEVSYPNNLSCLKSAMPEATPETKFMFSRFIGSLSKSKAPTNHSLGFSHAFEIIKTAAAAASTTGPGPFLVIYVSRGLLTSLEEGKIVLETISKGLQSLPYQVIINTCAVIDDGKPIMTEKQFLRDIADQNYNKYNISGPARVHPGAMQIINSTSSLTSIVMAFFAPLNITVKKELVFSMPYWDTFGKVIVVSISQPCFHLDEIVGVVGMDIQLSDIVEDVTYFNGYGATYAFMINKDGLAVMHPSFPRPSVAIEQPMAVDIMLLENVPNFQNIRKLILQNINGSTSVVTKRRVTSVPEKEFLQYTWQHLTDSPYIIVIVSINKGRPLRSLQKVSLATRASSLVYHRLDLLPSPPKVSICRHMRQLATLDTGVLFLSASCFQSPFEHLIHEEVSSLTVKSYMAYINDNTRLLANPGIKPSIKNDVAAIVQVMPHWKKQFKESSLNKYIVRSYAATPSGVFQMYPGSVLHHQFDPTRRAWYTRALEFPGRVVLTAPYLDVGGAGYIVTVSHTVYEGKAAAMHSASDTVTAVLGLDFTLGFFYKLLLDSMPFCDEVNVKCFILDDKGYLITHPSLIDPNGKGPAEQQHITHKEPLVANDILNHMGFVTKMLCNSFSDGTLQRFYQFNTSLSSVLTNLVHGEHCSKYQIAAVPGTNVFVGVVNSTCDVITAFCPCSMTDRLCLNCNRMEQTECECPCECSLEVDMCSGTLAGKDASNPSCPYFPEPPQPVILSDTALHTSALPPCFPHNCDVYMSQGECFGVLGCEWCQLDLDEETPLETPFCTHQSKCFNGVLGSLTPYGDSVLERQPSGTSGTYKTSPVGPVAGGMIGLILLVGVVIYCYRHNGHRSGTHAYMSSVPETAVRMSTLDNELDDPEEINDLSSHEKPESLNYNVLLHQHELPSAVSPYRVSTNYRRPPGCDSDHGYSTMTPHDDSEHLPCAEPLLLGKDFHSLSSNPHSSYVKSPNKTLLHSAGMASQTAPQTEICHQVLAPVTVHMVDSL